jgi:hypothetical protein
MKTEEQRLLDELYDRENRAVEVEDYLHDSQSSAQSPRQAVNYPDAEQCRKISFLKSTIRILSCIIGMFGLYEVGFIGLLLAEIVGIKQELV